MSTRLDTRQSVNRAALPMIGSAANDSLDTILAKIDPQLSKLFEDRNVLLTDGGLITFTGTSAQFSESLKLSINSQVAGGAPTIIDLAATTRNFSASGRMLYAVINRIAGTAVVTADATTLPAQVAANQEVFLIAKRVDAGDGTKRLYWRNGMALNEGQTARLGASGSGSGSGSGVGDDLDALLFRASLNDNFDENATNAYTSVNSTGTNATYSAAKGLYQISYDAAKTIAATSTTTNIKLSATAAFTVAVGDVVIIGSEVKKITTVNSQSDFITEAFSTTPTVGAQVTVSQAVHTKDIYGTAFDGSALSAAFGATTFSEILVDYEDSTTVDDAIFDVNVAPVIAFTASHDNSSYTTLQARATNETDTWQSTSLNAAGTALYLRFFANKTSGSGSVNILRYKAFMQKLPAVASGGILNAALGFTNGAGTPVNCSFSVVGGKTVVTLTWQYAVGVASSLPIGGIEVYVNGQMIPRFVNATLTPDASYTEIGAFSFQLDKDYSGLPDSVLVLQRMQIVDASTTNTTAITAHSEIFQQGFQGFVNNNTLMNATTVPGAPVSGSFYSSITNRASIVDFTQDLKPRIGIDRMMTPNLQIIYNEIGPNGEQVYGAINDTFNQIRFCGVWGMQYGDKAGSQGNIDNTSGQLVGTFEAGSFFEVTFYGTGFNFLWMVNNGIPTGAGMMYSVDGGSESAVVFNGTSSLSEFQRNRQYAENIPINVVSGLSLGVHTVKVRRTITTGGSFNVYGFEVVNESTSVKTQPGNSYINGQKLSLAAQSSIAYNSVVTGTKGGRVLVYQTSAGAIAQAFQPVDASQLTLNSSNHANEEIARIYHWREFGQGRTDDFSTLGASGSNRNYCLDDGTTALYGEGVSQYSQHGWHNLRINGSSAFITFTFVGTGLDITFNDDGSTRSVSDIFLDGVSISGAFSSSGLKPYVKRIASGLPYGTHTVKVSATASDAPWILNFIVYQPKKPTLPSGAVELSEYFVLANYAQPATITYTSGLFNVATGVIRKNSAKELMYKGSWSAISVDNGRLSGYNVSATAANDFMEVVFVGTGFELRFLTNSGGPSASTCLIDSSSNFSGFTTSVYGTGVGFTAATGVLDQADATTGHGGLAVQGLPYGIHTFRVTQPGATNMTIEAFDVITPVYVPKNNLYGQQLNGLPIGFQGISDLRKLTPVKDLIPTTKAWAQSYGYQGATTSVGTLAPAPNLSMTLKTNGGPIELNLAMMCSNNGANQLTFVQFVVDGVVPVQSGNNGWYHQNSSAGEADSLGATCIVPVSAGVHKVEVLWATGGSGTSSMGVMSIFTAKEL